MDPAQAIGLAVGLGSLAVLLLIIFIKANIVICQPNEVVIIAGRKRKLSDGTMVGYRLIRGGRGFKLPLIESVRRLPLTTRTVDVHLTGALCLGMIPIDIEGRSNVKLAGRDEEGLESAVERFLGRGVEAVDKTAQQVLAGALRGVVATVSPEEANAKRLDLAGDVAQRARAELSKLGIVLDFFQIQNISDERGYLEAIGRKRNAEILRDARIAEAEADAEATQVAAEQRRVGREAEVDSELSIVRKENALAVERANLQSEANQAEQRASVARDIARVQEEITLQSKRTERNEKRHQADTIIPAKAEREARMLEAQGKAARILEEGKATAEAIELMKAQWDNGETQELFMIRMLPELLDKVTRVVADNLRVEKLTILDGGNGEGMPTYVKNIANSAVVLLEQLKNTTGIDIEKMAAGRDEPDIPKQLS
jgi:flotillin